MTFCDCDDELPAHEHRAGDFWIHVDWKAVARELITDADFVYESTPVEYLDQAIHVLAEALSDDPEPNKNQKISESMKRYWKERKG